MAKATGRTSAPSTKKKPRHTAAQKKAARKAAPATGRGRGERTDYAPTSRPRRLEERSERHDRGDRYDRGDRGDRPAYAGNRQRNDRGDVRPRSDRNERGYERPRNDRNERGYERPRSDRSDRGYDRSRTDRGAAPARDWRSVHAAANGQTVDAVEQATAYVPARQQAAPAPRVAPVEMGQGNFEELGLDPRLVRKLIDQGITAPFPIQAATIPDALAGRDLLGRGQTGSGKTMAFGLPTLHRLAKGRKAAPHRPRAIVLTPTRELAMQIVEALGPLMRVTGLGFQLVAGGMSYTPQLRSLEQGVDVLVATPGRLMDLIERGAADLSQVEVTVLDEADHMSEMGFLEAITAILDLTPSSSQRLLFSATLDHGVDGVAKTYLNDPVTHSTSDATASVTTMDHHVFLVHPHDKRTITSTIANRSGRTLVFVRTKLGADRVAEQLRDAGIFAAALHGGLNQSARTRVLEAFKAGDLPVLVATDVAARGIHVDEISLVLQVDPPADHKDYLHRSGRTARAGETGMVVTLALPHQRRKMSQLLSTAGVSGSPQSVAGPEDDLVLRTAGGRVPGGPAIAQAQLTDLLRPKGRRFGQGSGGRRPGGKWAGPNGRGGPSRRGPGQGGQGRSGQPRGEGSRGDYRGRSDAGSRGGR